MLLSVKREELILSILPSIIEDLLSVLGPEGLVKKLSYIPIHCFLLLLCTRACWNQLPKRGEVASELEGGTTSLLKGLHSPVTMQICPPNL